MTVSSQICDPNTNSLLLNGSASYVEFGASNDLNITDELTIEAWIKASSWGNSPVMNSIVCKHGWTAGEKGYVLRAGGAGQLSFTIAGVKTSGIYDSWKEVLSPAGSLQLNTWHHVAGTYDGDKLRIYIDGNQVGSKNFKGSIAPSVDYNLRIGKIADEDAASGRYFSGLIDEVRIWNIKVSSTDIDSRKSEHINTGTVSNLIGYWRFNAGTGVTVSDRGSGNNQGTIMNVSWNTDVPFTNGITRPEISQFGLSLASNSLFGNQWNLNGVPISGETGILFTPQQGGEYSVTVDYGFGCIATSLPFIVSITSVFENNPDVPIRYYLSNGIIHFEALSNILNTSQLKISDLNGRIIVENKTIPEQLNMQSYAKGIYVLSFYSTSGFFSEKIVLQ